MSLYQPIFRQCPWHIRSTTSSNFLTMCVTYQDNCITVSSHFLTMSVTYQTNYLVKGRNGEKRKWKKIETQAVAEMGQAQVEDKVVVEARSRSCWWSWSSTTSQFGRGLVGGWSDKTKVILNSTQFKFMLKLELSLAK